MWDAGIGIQDVGCGDGWRVPGAAAAQVSSGVTSPGAKELQVAMSPPGGICLWACWSQECGVPALLAHRDLRAGSFPAGSWEEGKKGRREDRSTPAGTSPRQTNRQTGGRSSPGEQTRRMDASLGSRGWRRPRGGAGRGRGGDRFTQSL